MSDPTDLLPLAALLERAYRLALDIQDTRSVSSDTAEFIAIELVDVLDEARVAVLVAHQTARSD